MSARVGMVDSGLSFAQGDVAHAARSFTGEALTPDLLGHGTNICQIIRHHAPDISLYNAQVFDRRGVTTARAAAAAIDWLVAEGVDVINLSLGLIADRESLRLACERAILADIILIAASPARGNMSYPAAYPGLIRATGDARCDIDDISFLNSVQADFGGCPRLSDAPRDQPPKIGGASLGTAHISGQVAAFLSRGGERGAARQWLVSRAKYIHNERRTE